MDTILSLAPNNGNIFIEFVPDFRVDFIFSKSGDGLWREQAEVANQVEEPLATQISLPSKRSLDDLLVPGGIGTLEQIFFYSQNIAKPQILSHTISPSYLFFVLQPNHYLPAGIAHPAYNSFAPRQSQPYERYVVINRSVEYFKDVTYVTTETSSRIYPLVYAVFPSFDLQKYVLMRKDFAQIFSPANNYTDSQLQYAIKIPAYAKFFTPSDEIPKSPIKTALPIQERHDFKPMEIILFEASKYLPETHPITQKITTLQKGYAYIRLENSNVINNTQQNEMPYVLYRQEIQVYQPKLESRLNQALQTYGIPQAKGHVQEHGYGKAAQLHYKRDDHGYKPAKILVFPSGRNTSTSRAAPIFIGKDNVYDIKTGRKIPIQKTDYKKLENLAEQNDWQESKQGTYERQAEIEQNAEEKTETVKQKYKQKHQIKEETEKTYDTQDIQSNQPKEQSQKPEYRESSLVGDAAAVALGAGLMGLAYLVTLPIELRSKLKNQTQEVKYQPIDGHQNSKSIDSVVTSTADNEAIFTPERKNKLELLLNDARQIYRSVVMSVENYKTGEHYDSDGEKEEPLPCMNKVPLAFVVRYLAQQGKLDLNKKIKFNEKLSLKWERDKHPNDFYESALLSYERLEELMITRSSNTAYNHILQLIAGEGKDARESFPIINDELSSIGLYSTKIRSLHLRNEPYHLNVSSPNDMVKVTRHILTQKYLNSNNSIVLENHMSNEDPCEEFRKTYLKNIPSGTKVTLFEDGAGFVVFAGDFIFCIGYNKPLEPIFIYGKSGEKEYNPKICNETYRINGELFKFLYHLNNSSQKEYQQKKAA